MKRWIGGRIHTQTKYNDKIRIKDLQLRERVIGCEETNKNLGGKKCSATNIAAPVTKLGMKIIPWKKNNLLGLENNDVIWENCT